MNELIHSPIIYLQHNYVKLNDFNYNNVIYYYVKKHGPNPLLEHILNKQSINWLLYHRFILDDS